MQIGSHVSEYTLLREFKSLTLTKGALITEHAEIARLCAYLSCFSSHRHKTASELQLYI